MAPVPKAATQGGKGGSKAAASFPKAPGGAQVRVPSDRGGRSIGPTKCSAKGARHGYHG